MSAYPQIKTYSPDNKFEFECPIFNVTTKIASCFEVHRLWQKGRPPEVRKGCQACMSSNKCPIPSIDHIIRMSGDDPYYSAEPKVGNLKNNVLERIMPVMIQEKHMQMTELEGERAKMLEANRQTAEFANEKLASTPKVGKRKRSTVETASAPIVLEKVTPDEPTGAIIGAAASGDMSAAINAEMAKLAKG